MAASTAWSTIPTTIPTSPFCHPPHTPPCILSGLHTTEKFCLSNLLQSWPARVKRLPKKPRIMETHSTNNVKQNFVDLKPPTAQSYRMPAPQQHQANTSLSNFTKYFLFLRCFLLRRTGGARSKSQSTCRCCCSLTSGVRACGMFSACMSSHMIHTAQRRWYSSSSSRATCECPGDVIVEYDMIVNGI
jgi:hypothetical protein